MPVNDLSSTLYDILRVGWNVGQINGSFPPKVEVARQYAHEAGTSAGLRMPHLGYNLPVFLADEEEYSTLRFRWFIAGFFAGRLV